MSGLGPYSRWGPGGQVNSSGLHAAVFGLGSQWGLHVGGSHFSHCFHVALLNLKWEIPCSVPHQSFL